MFRPRTSREALLEIRRHAAQADGPRELTYVDEVASDGLDAHGIENYELTDQLADRLAEAHRVLRDLFNTEGDDPTVLTRERRSQIAEALALPPDLEAMVDRRL